MVALAVVIVVVNALDLCRLVAAIAMTIAEAAYDARTLVGVTIFLVVGLACAFSLDGSK